jgi:hypothetical protein
MTEWIVPRRPTGRWTSTSLRYALLITCVLSLCVCVPALLMAQRTSVMASWQAGSPERMPVRDPQKAVELIGSACAYVGNLIAWGLRALAIAVASVVGFLVLPAPKDPWGRPDVAWTVRRKTALSMFATTGILLLIGLAFLFGIGLTLYWMFSHMGP